MSLGAQLAQRRRQAQKSLPLRPGTQRVELSGLLTVLAYWHRAFLSLAPPATLTKALEIVSR